MTQPDIRPGVPQGIVDKPVAPEARSFTSRFPIRLNRETMSEELGDIFVSNPKEELPINEDRLRGRSAFISGSTDGIGRETALFFAKRGMNVVVHGRNYDRGIAVAQEVHELGGKATFISGDLSDAATAARVISESKDALGGKIDIGVVNAGFIDDMNAEDMTPEAWENAAHGNLDMGWYTTQILANSMFAEMGDGKEKPNLYPQTPNIIYMSSVSEFGNPGQPNYSAAKAGVEAAVKAMARRAVLLKRDVAFGIIRPILVNTGIITHGDERQARGAVSANKMIFRRDPLEADEVAHAAGYMATLTESGHVLTLR